MTAKYDAIAHWYDGLVENDQFTGSIISPALWELISDVKDKHVCDLSCGQGRIARELVKRHAIVTGVDLSSELIKLAKEKPFADKINYIVDDAQTLEKLNDSIFNLVVSNLALMDIPNIDKTFSSIRRVLKPQGSFVFSITHPCFEAPHAQWIKQDKSISRSVHSYVDEGLWHSTNKNGVRGQVGAHHRMLSTYINALAKTGFMIEQMIEPLMPQETATPTIGHQVIPAFMVIQCRIVSFALSSV